jgi:hypothetical protein
VTGTRLGCYAELSAPKPPIWYIPDWLGGARDVNRSIVLARPSGKINVTITRMTDRFDL